MLATGVRQLMSTPIKEHSCPIFWLKMQVLLEAVVFTFTLRRRITLADENHRSPLTVLPVGGPFRLQPVALSNREEL
jgi:hypothetical protein